MHHFVIEKCTYVAYGTCALWNVCSPRVLSNFMHSKTKDQMRALLTTFERQFLNTLNLNVMMCSVVAK